MSAKTFGDTTCRAVLLDDRLMTHQAQLHLMQAKQSITSEPVVSLLCASKGSFAHSPRSSLPLSLSFCRSKPKDTGRNAPLFQQHTALFGGDCRPRCKR